MARLIDFVCSSCGLREPDAIVEPDSTRVCPDCHGTMVEDWLPRTRHDAQWSDRDAVMVHVTHDPSVPADCRVRYVGSHDARLKPGYERVYLRSLREVDKFEREHHVMNHRMHYDQNGRGIDDSYRGSTEGWNH